MRSLLIFVSLFTFSVYAQKLPLVNFNHFYLVVDSADLVAIQNSDFIKNKFAATVTRTTKADSGVTWTGTYLEGFDNYLELFDSNGAGEPLGNAGVGFSVDETGEISRLDSILSKKYKTQTFLREKQFDNKKIPWFAGLAINDPLFDSLSHISFWVMEYKREYFDYNHWNYRDNKFTRATYLNQFAEERNKKILKRFTSITFRANSEEKYAFSNFLLSCGYKKMNKNSYASPEKFVLNFIPRNKSDRCAVAAVEFENNKSDNSVVKISDNILIECKGRKGKIIFR